MYRNAIAVCEPVAPRQTCIHFWVIKSAGGPFSRGTCKYCGAEREFKNYPTDCALEYTPFRELPGEPDKGEQDWNSFIEVEYGDMTAAVQGDDEYEREPDALCNAV